LHFISALKSKYDEVHVVYGTFLQDLFPFDLVVSLFSDTADNGCKVITTPHNVLWNKWLTKTVHIVLLG
jgi:hypothetical protein